MTNSCRPPVNDGNSAVATPFNSQPSYPREFNASSTFSGLNFPPNIRSFCVITLYFFTFNPPKLVGTKDSTKATNQSQDNSSTASQPDIAKRNRDSLDFAIAIAHK